MPAGDGTPGFRSYLRIARVDHWFKNVFMLLGVLLAFFHDPSLLVLSSVPGILLAVVAACLISSSNYVLNELIDAPFDSQHPVKKHRPVAAGEIRTPIAVVEWLGLGAAGLALAFSVNVHLGRSGLALWGMAILYNARPFRTKEIPYIDVLSESVNNPLRLLLGWFALIVDRVPPLSLVVSYWMAGAFFMAMKRLAEYRGIGDRATAMRYRRSFAHYDDDRLLVSAFFYATSCALFAGIFIVRYHVELVLFVPPAAGFFAYYTKLALMPASPVQYPERLYRVRGFLLYSIVCALVFVALMFVRIPALYEWFNIEPSRTSPLWVIGEPGATP